MLHHDLTNDIIGCFYKVYNTLGYGFLEKVYQNAMIIELRSRGLSVESQVKVNVDYKGFRVGDYYSDLFVENCVILELKACEAIADEHKNQLFNYLKATDVEVGLLLNFGRSPMFRRIVFENRFKGMDTKRKD